MKKEEWCEAHFGDELPECLPLPDKRKDDAEAWGSFSLPLQGSFDVPKLVASVSFLLGVYGGIEEAGFLARKEEGWIPLRLQWDKDTSPAALAAEAHGLLQDSASFAWTKQEAWDVLGQEKGKGIAFDLAGAIPQEEREGFALIFRAEHDRLLVSYAISCYTEEFIRVLLLSWREILLSFSEAGLLSDVRILAAETLAALDSFNQTARDYDRKATIVDQFRARAAEMPDNVAVIYEDRVYTYREVDSLSDRLAYYLAGQGLGRGDVVSVFIPRSEYMVIASLGVLKAGCAYEPLDPNYPDERLAFMAKDASAKLIIVDDSLLPRLGNFKEFSGGTLRISEIPSLPQPEAQATLQTPEPEDLFLLIYTSGTTGVPKGVRLLHRNLMAYAAWYRHYFAPTEKTRVTCYNSYGFDGSLADMYPTLTVGAAVVVIPEEKKLDLPALADIIRKHHISIADLPSQVGRQFALTMDCPDLKYIVVGGEKLVPFEPVYPYIIANEYGPTEATVSITCYDMTEYEPDIPIGTPMDNTAIYVVDGAGRRVPPGAVGELWVAGEQVTGGYLNRPEKTKEVFVPNPFSNQSAYETAYRTGDIVRYRMDGNIEFVGRRDGLVKIRGFRVELAEVEGVVHEFPPVRNAAVVACDNPAGGKFIAAYVVADEPVDKEALAAFIRERKPPYMVPAAIVQIDNIPRNQNGKLNRKALPPIEIHESAGAYVEPTSEVEAELAKGFAVALGMKRVSAAEDFFAAGGDSLSVVRLLSECRELKLNFNLVYEGKTPIGIAKLLSRREAKKKGQGESRETHFFGPLQELHYAWGNEIEEGYGVHCDLTIHLAPETEMERFASAVESALLAHPAVDARLTPTGDTFRWRSGDGKGLRPQVEQLSRAEYETLKQKLRRSMNKPETRMFSCRLFLIEEPDGQTSKDFYLDFLHPIIDGDSTQIFLEDVEAAYRGERLRPEEYSVFDYYDEMEEAIAGEEYKKQQQWNHEFVRSFTGKLNELPGDLDPKGENDTQAIFVPLHIDMERVDRFLKEQGITEGTLFSAAFGLMQGHRNGEQAAVSLTIYNGRDDIRFERTMGALYRHYPLCARWTDDMTAASFVKETQDNILLCRRHALYEGEPVPLIISFAYQGEDMDGPFAFCGGMARQEWVEDHEEENFNFYVYRRQDDFHVNLTYNTKEYSEAFISRFVENYAKVVHALAKGGKIADIVKMLDGK